MTLALRPRDFRDLIRAGLPGAPDADTAEPDIRQLFTPSGHRLALDPEVTVVKGGRGVGKTVWFKVLQDERLRAVAADAYQLRRLTTVTPHIGFGAALDPARYPGRRVLESLLKKNADPLDIWTAVLLVAFNVQDLPSVSWLDRVRWVEQNPEILETTLAEIDSRAREAGRTHLILFDALERLHEDRNIADRLVGGVLRLALDLRTRTRNIRAKVFIRHDMFESGLPHSPDSSKLLNNAADITWSETNLFGLLFHQLGNSESRFSAVFRTAQPRWRADSTGGEVVRYEAPPELLGNRLRQQELFVEIAGPYMGANHRKGHTYTWLPNHLMDGKSQVSPRSFLRALVVAAIATDENHADYQYPLHYDSIRVGVQEASRIRVSEITEDIPWVATAIGALKNMQVPIEISAIVDRWSSVVLGDELARTLELDESESNVRAGPINPNDYRRLVAELLDIGIMRTRADGRVDLPDVYRIAFDIGRRGGIPRLTGS